MGLDEGIVSGKREMKGGNRKIILLPDDSQERSTKTAREEIRLLHAALSGADTMLLGVQALRSEIKHLDLTYDKNGLDEEASEVDEPYSDLSVSFDQINTLRHLAVDSSDWMPELRRLQPVYASILYRDLLNHIGRLGEDEEKFNSSILRFYEAKSASFLICFHGIGKGITLF